MSFGRAINDAGRIVGWSLTLNDELAHAFFYEKGVMTDISSFGDADSYGTAINNGGQIVGYFTKDNATYGFLYDKGVVRVLVRSAMPHIRMRSTTRARSLVGCKGKLLRTRLFIQTARCWTSIC